MFLDRHLPRAAFGLLAVLALVLAGCSDTQVTPAAGAAEAAGLHVDLTEFAIQPSELRAPPGVPLRITWRTTAASSTT
jgi:hypothetical protein